MSMTDDSWHVYALKSGTCIGDYEIERTLGDGGFGLVYLATERELGGRFAIKEYLPNEFAVRVDGSTVSAVNAQNEEPYKWGLDKFLEEARNLRRLADPKRHDNIVEVRQFIRDNNTAYMVMSYEEGDDLEDYLAERDGPLPQKKIEELIFPLLDGLAHVHRLRIFHRDIKPRNIKIRHDGSPVLLDFGAATNEICTKTKSRYSACTPPYAAFEQYSTIISHGAYTDIYNMGVTMYQMVTGDTPPEATDRAAMAANDEDMPLLVDTVRQGYDRNFLEAIDASMMLHARDRPQSVEEWLEIFKHGSSSEPKTMLIANEEPAPPIEDQKQIAEPKRTVDREKEEIADIPAAVTTKKPFPFLPVGVTAAVVASIGVAAAMYMSGPNTEDVVTLAGPPGLHLKEDVRKGETLSAEMFHAITPTNSLEKDVPVAFAQVDGGCLVKNIKAGQIMSWNEVGIPDAAGRCEP